MLNLQPIVNKLEISGFNGICYFEFGKNFTHAPEKHDFWEMVYVDSGNIVAITDGNSSTLSQGQIIFHEPNEIHAHISDSESPNNMLVISFNCESSEMNFFRKKIFTADKTTKTLLGLFVSEVKNALGNIPDEYGKEEHLDFSNAEFGALELLLCYYTEMLINLIRKNSGKDNKVIANEKSRTLAQNSLSSLVCEYMKENVYSSLTLDDVCSHFMLAKSQLSHIFKGAMGKSPMEYYNGLRISEARKLLRGGAYSVSQISDMLGFSCIHSFSRSFKNAVGTSPTEYKKRIV
ncbi:MAG: helix-turn-helix transcriptional regulator [Clostridia bacterium]|nr:helix-turn-helix transcriptional regulator [Clostridia bacterium]